MDEKWAKWDTLLYIAPTFTPMYTQMFAHMTIHSQMTTWTKHVYTYIGVIMDENKGLYSEYGCKYWCKRPHYSPTSPSQKLNYFWIKYTECTSCNYNSFSNDKLWSSQMLSLLIYS